MPKTIFLAYNFICTWSFISVKSNKTKRNTFGILFLNIPDNSSIFGGYKNEFTSLKMARLVELVHSIKSPLPQIEDTLRKIVEPHCRIFQQQTTGHVQNSIVVKLNAWQFSNYRSFSLMFETVGNDDWNLNETTIAYKGIIPTTELHSWFELLIINMKTVSTKFIGFYWNSKKNKLYNKIDRNCRLYVVCT